MKKPRRLRNHASLVRVSAWSYLLVAILYPVFTLSSMQLAEKDNISQFLVKHVNGGSVDHVLWLAFALIPMFLVFGAIGFYSAVKPYAFKTAGLSLAFSVVAAIGFMLGIGRWSSLNWGLGEAFLTHQEKSHLITHIYHFSNEVLGYWAGHIVAEISLFVAIGFMAYAMYDSKRFPTWLCGFGGLVFILGFSTVFRNDAIVAQALYVLMNTLVLVPLFFLLLSIALFRFGGSAKEKPLARYAKRKKSSKQKKFFKKAKPLKKKRKEKA